MEKSYNRKGVRVSSEGGRVEDEVSDMGRTVGEKQNREGGRWVKEEINGMGRMARTEGNGEFY